MIRAPDAKSDCYRRGKAKVRILNFKTTWSEFQKPRQTAATQDKAELRIYNLKKHHLPRFGPMQLCASAHLESTTKLVHSSDI